MAYVTNFGDITQKLDQADVILKATRQGLEASQAKLNTFRTTTMPIMDRKLTGAEQAFNRTLRLMDMPIPKVTPNVPVGLLAGGAAIFLIVSTIGLMLYVDTKRNDEPRKARRP